MMAKLILSPPLINASGILSYPDIFRRLEQEGALFGGYVTKSIGPQAKEGNEPPTVFWTGTVLLNSVALPTASLEEYRKEFEETMLEAPLIGSVYGHEPKDYQKVIESLDGYVQGWELNLNCPNRRPDEKETVQERMTAALIEETVKTARDVTDKTLIAKLSAHQPYRELVPKIEGAVDYIACSNTLGPGLSLNIYSRKPILTGRTGGLSGAAIRPVVMRMVYEIYPLLDHDQTGIIAYGGISTWQDIIEYALAGAEIFGLGTSLMNKSTEDIVRFTHQLWDGCVHFAAEQGCHFEDLIGGAHGL